MTIFNKFANYVIINKSLSVCDVFNRFSKHLTQEEQKFVGKNYMLIIKAGEAARKAPPEVQQSFK